MLDFGLAKIDERQMRPGSVVLTQEGMVFGTPEFMSPEQAQGKKLTPSSDVYSLAVILYEVLTGKLPFDAKSAMDFIQLHVTGKPVLLNERVPGKTFPPLLERVIDRALAKRPEDRFVSAADFAMAMRHVVDGATELGRELAPRPPERELSTVPIDAQQVKDLTRAHGPRPRPDAPASPGLAGPVAQAPSLPALKPSLPLSAPRKNANVFFLVAIALGFMAIGVVLALVLMRFVLR